MPKLNENTQRINLPKGVEKILKKYEETKIPPYDEAKFLEDIAKIKAARAANNVEKILKLAERIQARKENPDKVPSSEEATALNPHKLKSQAHSSRVEPSKPRAIKSIIEDYENNPANINHLKLYQELMAELLTEKFEPKYQYYPIFRKPIESPEDCAESDDLKAIVGKILENHKRAPSKPATVDRMLFPEHEGNMPLSVMDIIQNLPDDENLERHANELLINAFREIAYNTPESKRNAHHR